MTLRGGIATVAFGGGSASQEWTIGAIGFPGEAAGPVTLLGELGGGESDGVTWLPGDAVHVQYLGADLAPASYTVIYNGEDVTADTIIWTGHPDGIPRLLYSLPEITPGGERIFTPTVTDHDGNTETRDYTINVLWTAPPYMVANVAFQNLGSPTERAGPPPAGIGRYSAWVAVAAIYGHDDATAGTAGVPHQIRIRVHVLFEGVTNSYDWSVDLTPDTTLRRASGSFVANFENSAARITGIELGVGSVALDYNYCYFNPPSIFLPATVIGFTELPQGGPLPDNMPVIPEYPTGEFA